MQSVRRRWQRCGAFTAGALLLAACGTRVAHSDVVASALGTRQVPNAAVAPASGHGSADSAGPTAPQGPTVQAGPSGQADVGGTTAGPAASGSPTTVGPSSAATGSALSGTPVVVGNIGTYSGIIGALFNSGQQMAFVWAKWVNAHGGVSGHPVQVLSADDRGDPGQYLSEVKDMVENHHVIAFVGNLVPLSATGAEQYLEQKQIPVVGGDSTSNIWFQSPVLFPDATHFSAFSQAAAHEAVAAGKPKVAIIYCSEVEACHTWNDSLQGGAAAKQGASIAYSAQVSLAQPDFTSECLQSQSHGAQALLAAVDANSLVRLSRDCAQQGYHPLYVAVSLAVVDAVATDPNLQGLVAPQGTFPWPANDTPAAQDYQTAIRQFAPGLQGSGASSSVWTSGRLFEEAAAHLPAHPTPHDLFSALWTIKNDTLGGLAPPVTFTQGKGATPSTCYFLVEVAGGKWVAPNGSKSQCI